MRARLGQQFVMVRRVMVHDVHTHSHWYANEINYVSGFGMCNCAWILNNGMCVCVCMACGDRGTRGFNGVAVSVENHRSHRNGFGVFGAVLPGIFLILHYIKYVLCVHEHTPVYVQCAYLFSHISSVCVCL